MRGMVEIDRNSGVVESKLSQYEEGATLSEVSEEQLQEIGMYLTHLLQDVNSYMWQVENQTGALEKMTLKLDTHHFVNIVVSDDKIKA